MSKIKEKTDLLRSLERQMDVNVLAHRHDDFHTILNQIDILEKNYKSRIKLLESKLSKSLK